MPTDVTAAGLARQLKWSSWEEAIEVGGMTAAEIDAITRLGYAREKPTKEHCDAIVDGVVFNYTDKSLAGDLPVA